MPRHNSRKPGSLRAYFGAKLRRQREARRFSLERLAEEMGYSAQWLHKMEATDKSISEKFAEDCATYFKDPEFIELREDIIRAGRLVNFSQGFSEYLVREEVAASVREFSPQVIPGLLQTENYARALMVAAGHTPDVLEERIATRVDRQRILTKVPYTEFQFIIHEAALITPVGGSQVMREQIEQIIEIADRPNVRIWVLPFSSVTYAALDGIFALLGFEDGSGLMYVEPPELSQVIEDPEIVARGDTRFGILAGEALPHAASLDLIKKHLKEYLQ